MDCSSHSLSLTYDHHCQSLIPFCQIFKFNGPRTKHNNYILWLFLENSTCKTAALVVRLALCLFFIDIRVALHSTISAFEHDINDKNTHSRWWMASVIGATMSKESLCSMVSTVHFGLYIWWQSGQRLVRIELAVRSTCDNDGNREFPQSNLNMDLFSSSMYTISSRMNVLYCYLNKGPHYSLLLFTWFP